MHYFRFFLPVTMIRCIYFLKLTLPNTITEVNYFSWLLSREIQKLPHELVNDFMKSFNNFSSTLPCLLLRLDMHCKWHSGSANTGCDSGETWRFNSFLLAVNELREFRVKLLKDKTNYDIKGLIESLTTVWPEPGGG